MAQQRAHCGFCCGLGWKSFWAGWDLRPDRRPASGHSLLGGGRVKADRGREVNCVMCGAAVL